jgi:UDP-glucose 4-epimerase
MTSPTTLVIGSHGLLGRAVMAAVERRGAPLAQAVRWDDDAQAQRDLANGLAHLIRVAGGDPWRVIWCAGVGVTTTRAEELEREVATLRRFLEAVGDAAAAPGTGPGTVFFASSAGGVYAGSDDPPFTEATTPRPISPYGAAKLAAENVVSERCRRAGVSALIGRIANLYGPGQNVRKPQGLITQLCRARLTGQPTSIYVSLDTLRDYLFTPDCADMILDGLDRLDRHRLESADPDRAVIVTKILASQRSVSIGALLMETRRIFRRPPRVLVAASSEARAQARDLRLRSVVWPELDQRAFTSLAAGIRATSADIELGMMAGAGRV